MRSNDHDLPLILRDFAAFVCIIVLMVGQIDNPTYCVNKSFNCLIGQRLFADEDHDGIAAWVKNSRLVPIKGESILSLI